MGPRLLMNIALITPDGVATDAPGCLAALSASLPKALRGLGHRITVIAPLPEGLDPTSRSLARRLSKLSIADGDSKTECELYDGRSPAGVDLLFVAVSALVGGESRRMQPPEAIFAGAALQIVAQQQPAYDAVHALGSAGSALLAAATHGDPALRSTAMQASRKPWVWTLIEGQAAAVEAASAASLASTQADEASGEAAPKPPLQLVVPAATIVRQLRSTHASQLSATPGAAMESALGSTLSPQPPGRAKPRLSCVPQGIDTAQWNPTLDAHLAARFDAVDRSGKASCKAALQQELGLDSDSERPLVAIWIGTQSGLDASHLEPLLRAALRNPAQLVLCLENAASVDVERLQALCREYPAQLGLAPTPGLETVHRIVAACDLWCVATTPSQSELLAFIGQRYGAMPIVALSDWTTDSIVDIDAELRTGNGVLYDATATPSSPEDSPILGAIQRGIAAFTHREAFAALQHRLMRLDHSCERSARLYEGLYQRLPSSEMASP